MFIYLVAPVATLVFIFGLLYIKRLDNWLRSSIRCSLTLYNGLIYRTAIQASLNNRDSESNLTSESPMAIVSDRDRVEYDELLAQKTVVNNNERLPDAFLEEVGNRSKNLNPPRYSFEDIVSEERNKDLGLREVTYNNITRTSKEGKENILETLKSSVEKSNYPSSRLNKQIYNLILKEGQKEYETRQKLLDSDNNKFNEPLSTEIKEYLPSSSEKKLD
ncbi:uncharacterized protein LOC132906834 [Bombus pascuorum]|uniref:uncharacterized protein LOC132906834 n=1 Tax=Bombus pascuorum TaxID=65598 RepID=UPI00298E278D|nr:uncharacterized protein LOC132906834 [Bombus pascuorum]